MISGKERRRAVAELREASTGAYRHVDALDVIAGAVGVDAEGKLSSEIEKETYAALAELIDRPTCKNVADPYDGSYFECSRCGEKWELTCGSPADNHLNYCPDCGAKVVSNG